MVWLSRLLRSARWRQLPATATQQAFVAKRWGMRPTTLIHPDASMTSAGESSFPDEVKKLTKGQAANIITRLKHGAQVRCASFFIRSIGCAIYGRTLFSCVKARYAKKVKDKLKAEKVATKERMRRAREHVRVGPLHSGDSAKLLVEDKKDAFLS